MKHEEMNMDLRWLFRNFVSWFEKKVEFKEIIIDYEVAELYLEQNPQINNMLLVKDSKKLPKDIKLFENGYKEEKNFIRKMQCGVLLDHYSFTDMLWFMKNYKDKYIKEKGFNKIKPIDISHENLLSLGFKTKNKKIGWYKKEGFNFTLRKVSYGLDIYLISGNLFQIIKHVRYLHELKNFYFIITNEELIIK